MKKYENKVGFEVTEEENKVKFSQVYHKRLVSAVAKTHGDDVFNVELGKALAFAKCELKVRNMEVASTTKAMGVMSCFAKVGACEAKSLWSKEVNQVRKYLLKIRKYRDNQKAILALIATGTVGGSNYKEILQNAHDAICIVKADEPEDASAQNAEVSE